MRIEVTRVKFNLFQLHRDSSLHSSHEAVNLLLILWFKNPRWLRRATQKSPQGQFHVKILCHFCQAQELKINCGLVPDNWTPPISICHIIRSFLRMILWSLVNLQGLNQTSVTTELISRGLCIDYTYWGQLHVCKIYDFVKRIKTPRFHLYLDMEFFRKISCNKPRTTDLVCCNMTISDKLHITLWYITKNYPLSYKGHFWNIYTLDHSVLWRRHHSGLLWDLLSYSVNISQTEEIPSSLFSEKSDSQLMWNQ